MCKIISLLSHLHVVAMHTHSKLASKAKLNSTSTKPRRQLRRPAAAKKIPALTDDQITAVSPPNTPHIRGIVPWIYARVIVPAERSSWGDYETGSVRVCVCPSVRPSGLKMLKFASSLSFLGRFWFCLFYLIGLGAGSKTSTTEFWNSLIMQIYANLFKINEKCHLSSIQKITTDLHFRRGRILRIA